MTEPLRVVLIRENRFWIAQALEHDIGAQGEDLKDVVARLALALDHEREMLRGLPPAPPYFQHLWPLRAGLFAPERPIAGVVIAMIA